MRFRARVSGSKMFDQYITCRAIGFERTVKKSEVSDLMIEVTGIGDMTLH